MEGLATPKELAEYLNVKEQTLRNWAHQGRGPAFVMVEGARRYRWTDVRDYLDARTVKHD